MTSIRNHIPNAITAMNLLCGCLAIAFVINGRMVWAAWAVMAATVLDFFDGFAARLLHAKSEIGKQLDSLADVVSFGVAPGMILMQLLRMSESVWKFGIPDFVAYIAFLIPLCAALRLAKFNTDPRQTDSFIGLPSPAAGICLAVLPLLLSRKFLSPLFPFNDYVFHFVLHPAVLIGGALLLSFLMVSGLPMFSMKFKSAGWKENKLSYIFISVSALMIALFFFTAIPLIIVLYIVISSVKYITQNKKQFHEVHSRN